MIWLLLVVSLSRGMVTFAPTHYHDANSCNRAADIIKANTFSTTAVCIPAPREEHEER